MLTTIKSLLRILRNTRLEEGEYITSFDVTSLFTSIPVVAAIEVIKGRLELPIILNFPSTHTVKKAGVGLLFTVVWSII